MKGGLTDTTVRRLKPKSRPYELTCTRLPGFAVRVLPSGRKVFLVRHRVDGKDCRARIGQWGDDLTADDARRQAVAILTGVSEPAQGAHAPGDAAGGDAAPRTKRARRRRARAAEHLESDPSPAQETTLAELADRFEREYTTVYLKPATAANYKRLLREFILPELGKRHFESIRRRDVKAMHARLSDRPALADHAVCVIGSLYTRIIDDWELTEMRNPAAGVRRFGSRKVERFLSPEERRAVNDALEEALTIPRGRKGHIEPFSAWAIKLLMLTGLRRGEILSLTWPMVDWQHACFHLPETKTGQRTVIVSDAVIALLREIHDATGNPRSGLVVRSSRGTKLTGLNVTWSRVREMAGIPDVRLHDLRHSFASDALMAGVPLAIVGEMLGHRQPSTTKRYAHLADRVVREALATTTERIVSATAGGPKPSPVENPFVPLTDAQWAKIAPLVEADRPRGGSPVDLRGVVDGIRWRIERKARWREIPERFGMPTTCWRWHKRWVESGVWLQLASFMEGTETS